MIKSKKALFLVLAIVIPLFLIYLFVPYIRVDNLTKKYGSGFEELYNENGFYSGIEYLKVFQYQDEKVNIYGLDDDRLKKELSNLGNDYAVVLYIEENHSSASLFTFYDENGKWKLLEWNTIWSYGGTADGFMWPYYF